jgi:adenine-specific DNA-methyltransferase
MAKKSLTLKSVETLKHDEAKRRNVPTAEHQSVIQKEQEAPRTVKYPRNTGRFRGSDPTTGHRSLPA